MCLENGGMTIKKIYFSLLFGVLLFILLSTFSSSYGAQYNITSYNVDEFLNYYTNWYNAPSLATIKNRFNGYLNTYNNSYDNSIVEVYMMSNGKFFFYLYFFNNNNISSARYTSATNWRIDGTGILRCSPLDNTTYTINNYISGNTSRGQYFMISNPVRTIQTAPFQSSNVMTFITDYFEYNYNLNLNNLYVDEDFPLIKQIYYGISGDIAEFGLTTFLDKVTLTYWKYEKERGYFEPFLSKEVTSYSIINSDIGYLYTFKRDFIPNTIMQYTLVSNDLESFSSLGVSFYAVDGNTIIDNGNLNVNDTFNDDYYNKYINIINNLISDDIGKITNNSGDVIGNVDYSPITEKIDELTSTSGVDATIDNFLSGDYNSFAVDLGYSPIDNPFTTFLLDLFTNVYNSLTVRQDIVFSEEIHGVEFTINTRDFIVPESILKNVVKILLIFLYIYGNYKFFHKLLVNVEMANIDGVIKNIGTDEFNDSYNM